MESIATGLTAGVTYKWRVRKSPTEHRRKTGNLQSGGTTTPIPIRFSTFLRLRGRTPGRSSSRSVDAGETKVYIDGVLWQTFAGSPGTGQFNRLINGSIGFDNILDSAL
jgi:hypothetical protein